MKLFQKEKYEVNRENYNGKTVIEYKEFTAPAPLLNKIAILFTTVVLVLVVIAVL